MKRKPLNLDSHLILSKKVIELNEIVVWVFNFMAERLPKTSQSFKTISFIFDKVRRLKSQLDDNYHAQITDGQFDQYGHVYYQVGRQKKLFILEEETKLIDGWYDSYFPRVEEIKKEWDERRPQFRHIICETYEPFYLKDMDCLNRAKHLTLISGKDND